MSLDYYDSERFIHDGLIDKAQAAVDCLHEIWRENGKIDTTLITWPAENVRDDSGELIDGVCVMSLPEDESKHIRAISAGVERSKAYGFLLLEQKNNTVRALLETPHGTRLWTLPIIRSADSQYLGEAKITNDLECIGLIWRPQIGAA